MTLVSLLPHFNSLLLTFPRNADMSGECGCQGDLLNNSVNKDNDPAKYLEYDGTNGLQPNTLQPKTAFSRLD